MAVGFLLGVSSCWSDCTHVDCWPEVFGEIAVTPEQIPADGQTNAEVAIFLHIAWETCGIYDKPLTPAEGVVVRLESSRNSGGAARVDIIEQPTGATDADGRTVAYLWSSTPGEAQLRVTQEGSLVCENWEGNECLPLEAIITFVE
jgi:hypothetical protein